MRYFENFDFTANSTLLINTSVINRYITKQSIGVSIPIHLPKDMLFSDTLICFSKVSDYY